LDDPRPQPTSDKLKAAIRLLTDHDPRILAACRKQLLLFPELARPLLRECFDHEDPQLRVRVRAVLSSLDRREWLAEFEAFARRFPPESGQDVELEAGALLLARFARKDLDVHAVGRTLDAWANELKPRIAGKGPVAVATELRKFFHEEKLLRGNHQSYYEPDNSFLDQVLVRRRGIPIALSVVYLLVGARAGLPLEGVGMPGHFLVRLRGPRSVLLDPFHGGRVLTRADCILRLRTEGYEFHPSHLDAVDHRRILVRMLGNLMHIHGFREDPERVALLSSARAALVGVEHGRRAAEAQ
jgi:regulator of sirC expression with transglutaminase-like and TPR domain